ncbi:hypothetical protein BN159_2110 [Streptomyces davaonensis JCM 4913]|uniref:NACHT domain-containing protein n=1 Tax=Streptomyces davaonensis (strain DSM 101723 / JCM 4913 / KCC S-0913 / 768) TaxID=1214101 RepID=K4R1F0_STRDJ|nr:hypothetical protein BN159_2110 [Streptomyces davaonensis JCM 4913]
MPWAKIDVRVGHPRDHPDVHVRLAAVRWTDPEERDVALLLLDDAVHVPGTVRWGRPVGNDPLPYDSLAYPSATFRDGQHKVEHLRGKLPPQAGGVGAQDLHVLDQDVAPDLRADGEPAWSGASGSAVFCWEHLVGVVIHDDHVFANRRLHACPARTFVGDSAFVELLQEYGDGPPELVDITASEPPSDRDRSGGPHSDMLRDLRSGVRRDLRKDVYQQTLLSGESLPLNCRAAPEEFTGSRNGARDLSEALAKESPLGLAGSLENIAAVYQEDPKERHSKLLVLGEAGSGKTVLIRRFAQALVEDDGWRGPVPVIFSLGSWDPYAQSLQDWLVDCLKRDHRFLTKPLAHSGTWAGELIGRGDVLVILDGFDELAKDRCESALRQISAVDLPLLLTSRPEALRGVKLNEGLFPGIELTGLTLDDCFTSLEDPSEWAPVLRKLGTDSGELDDVRITPLMLTLVKEFPDGLKSLRDLEREELEQRLLKAFISRRYAREFSLTLPEGRRWSVDSAGHWLGYLARHLQQQRPDAQDIEWWQLGTTMSLPARMVVSGGLCALVSGTVVALVHALRGDLSGVVLLTMIVDFLGTGLAFGLAHGFASKVKASRAFEPSRMQIRLHGGPWTDRLGRVRESFLPRVGGGLAGGLVYGTVFGGGSAVYAMLLSSPWSWVALVFGNWLVTGLLLGLAVGIVLALVAFLETDARPEESASATDLLRANRTIALVQLVAAGLIIGLGFGAAVTRFDGFAIGLWSGIAVGLLVMTGVGTLTAWGRWVVLVRLWLPLSGRLPWRMNTFLGDARARGVLRQAGAVHQFRHARLRDHLAEAHQQGEQPTPPESR